MPGGCCDHFMRCLWWFLISSGLHPVYGANISHSSRERPSCQPGFYCLPESFTPIPCPRGTYGPAADGVGLESCLKCPPHHYCPRPGLSASIPCGLVAQQPLSGQDTCICPGKGQNFQRSDGQCQCTLDYQPTNSEDVCVHKVYSICRDGKTRTQHGDCLDRHEWSHHCRTQVCSSAEDYEAYDGELGLCVCAETPGQAACGGLCRKRLATELKLPCKSSGELELVFSYHSQVTNLSGTILEMLFKLWDSHGSLQCTGSHLISSRSVYIVRTSEAGFVGLLGGSLPEELQQLLMSLTDVRSDAPRAHGASVLPWDMHIVENISSGGGNMSSSKSVTGIINPITCLHLGDVLLFTVTTRDYPQYDIDNLYNTNSDFDWGALRKLKEELTLSRTPPSFFSIIFNQPGVYVFRLSSHHHKRMYVRVMLAGGQCYEPGPFFSTIPRHMTRVGIRKRRNLLLRPDWLVTGGLLFGAALILCLCVIVLILFHEYGWPEKKPITARYHSRQLTYHMEDYASKGSRVISQMKIHRKQQATCRLTSIQPGLSEEFWDYEHQVDLEAFSSNTFYNLLLKHSVSVTARLGQLTTEVKELYQGVLEKLRLLHPRLVDEESTGDVCDKTRREVEKEVGRRRSLAAHLRTLLHAQLQVLRREQEAQQKVHNVFTAQLRECTKILGKIDQTSFGLYHQNLIQRLRSLVGEMGGLVSAECQRQRSWGLLGEGTGAKLLCPDTGTVLSKDSIFGSDGSLRDCCPAHYDAVTGLIRPNAHSHMLLSSGHTMAVPPNFFLHPQTGHVLPIPGNVAYDPESSTLLITTDLCAGDNRKWESPPIPFIPYPTSSHSNQPQPNIRLRSLRPGQKLQLGAPMADPDTGVPVPILAITIHPQTGLVYPLGKTHICPITRLPQPIQIGYPMLEPRTENVVLTVGICIDPVTGVVLPVGGVMLGEPFMEPLSGRMARVGGGSIQAGQLVPHAGGYQTLLDSKVLAVMFKIVELLRPLSDDWSSEPALQLHQRGEQASRWHDSIGAVAEELHLHWKRSQHCQLQLQTRLEILQDTMVGLHQDGCSLGDMALSGSNAPVPALLGMDYPDPMGSGLTIPVLGYRTDFISGTTIGLAGTMEDPDGNGLVAIRYGSQAIDPVTATLAPVVGARLDVLTDTVVPITASYWLAVADQTDTMQVEALEREVRVRNIYWQQQRWREEDILADADSAVFQCFLRVMEAGCYHEVQWSGRPLREAAVEMHDLAQTEAQRRAAQRAALALILPPHVLNILILVDEEEWDQHCVWYTELVSGIDMMDLRMEQLQQDQDKWSSQRGLEWAANVQSMDRELRLGEILEQCSSRLSDLDAAFIKLQSVRHLSKLRSDTAQEILCGNFWYKEYGLIRLCQPRPTGNVMSLLERKILPQLDRMNQQFVSHKQLVNLSTNRSHQYACDTGPQPDKAIPPPSHIVVPTIPEEEWTNLLELSPLFQLLKGVEQELKGKSVNRFVDVLERQWECEGELIPLKPSSLSPRELLVYQHGLFLMHTMNALHLTPDVSLQIATSLPNNNYHNNAFRNSFFYQEEDETLFVRQQRLHSVGGFSLLLLHCLSHIATKDISNDSAPAFGRLFCKVLQASLGELFQAKLDLDVSSTQEAHCSFRDEKSPQGRSKSFILHSCEEPSASLPQPSGDIVELERKHRETSLVSQLEAVLRQRTSAREKSPKKLL
ncbi:uncharacterized protein LOC127609336 isoform X2 [Hippocampus zosterae]|uniref:uncharacterized protein LOC127609336 isoform X2 n=1 Tax=Hippocampus zosterae TaxID=109293 RepID=UPI00223D91F8|nr:uncharacterized protein LOC127609336 isoform X2 [Hippocampus zosterae]